MRKKKKSSRKQVKGGAFLTAVQIPADLSYRECVLTFYGGREVVIENYRRILAIDEHQIRLLTRNGILVLEGSQLVIASYSPEEMKIRGHVKRALFEG